MSHHRRHQSPRDSSDIAFLLLTGWLVLIVLFFIFRASLSRHAYNPQGDLLIAASVTLGSWHAARSSRALPLFFIFGSLAGVLLVLSHWPDWPVALRMDLGIMPLVPYGLCWFAVIMIVGMTSRGIAHSRHVRMDRSTPPDTCLKCGYLLHGLPEPRCPECGEPFEPPDVLPSDSLNRNGSDCRDES